MAQEPNIPSFLRDPKEAARQRLQDLLEQERKRAQVHIQVIRRAEPSASNDRVANVILDRWAKVAAVEGGITGFFGLAGVPMNLLLFTYCQVAVTVSIAETYGIELRGQSGEDALLDIIGKAHGVEDVVRNSPRVLGALARALAFRHGLGIVGRMVPMLAAPISARLNQREMQGVGREAMRRFGNVLMIG